MNHHSKIRTLLTFTVFAAIACQGVTHAAESFQISQHLKDPALIRGDDGVYYLTGTTNINTLDPKFADFQNNDGIRLWKSTDLTNWEEVGLVWNLGTDPQQTDYKTYHGAWQEHLRLVPGEPDREWSRGVTAPELHRIGDDYYFIFALNDQAIGLLKSTSGKPEGPYEEIGRLPNRFLGGDGSLFVDENQSVFCLWGAGMIARMKKDMSGFDEKPWSLMSKIRDFPMNKVLPGQHNERGPRLVRQNGKYRFLFTADTFRNGEFHTDTLVCEADAMEGPYSAPEILIPDSGQVAVFPDETQVKASYFDDEALVITPLN